MQMSTGDAARASQRQHEQIHESRSLCGRPPARSAAPGKAPCGAQPAPRATRMSPACRLPRTQESAGAHRRGREDAWAELRKTTAWVVAQGQAGCPRASTGTAQSGGGVDQRGIRRAGGRPGTAQHAQSDQCRGHHLLGARGSRHPHCLVLGDSSTSKSCAPMRARNPFTLLKYMLAGSDKAPGWQATCA